MVSEMAMNVVIQKHASLPGTPVTLTNNHNTQSFFIPRPSEGIHVAPLSWGGTTCCKSGNQRSTFWRYVTENISSRWSGYSRNLHCLFSNTDD